MSYNSAYQHSLPGQHPDIWVLVLDRYQRDNLLWLLNLCGRYRDSNGQVTATEPFTLANTGDWLGEITQMLAKVSPEDRVFGKYRVDEEDHPNISIEEMRNRIQEWFGRMTKPENKEGVHNGSVRTTNNSW